MAARVNLGFPRIAVAPRVRYLPRLVRLSWDVDPAATLLLGLLSIGAGLFPVAQVNALRQLVETAQRVAAGSGQFDLGLAWGGVIASLGLLEAIVGQILSVTRDRHQEVLRHEIEDRCYRQAQTMPLEELERGEHYDRLERARRGTERRLFATMRFFWDCISNAVVLVSVLLYLGQFQFFVPVLLALGTTVATIGQERFNRRQFLLDRQQTSNQRRFSTLSSLLTGREGAAEIRLFGLSFFLIEQTMRIWRHMVQERMQLVTIRARMRLVTDGTNALVYILAVVFGVELLITGRMGVGAIAAFFVAIEQFQSSYGRLVNAASQAYSDLRYLEDFFNFLDGPRLDLEEGQRFRGSLSQGIVFDHVSFTYPGRDQPALLDINLAIKPGEHVALVGENGAGKTTLVMLLMGLYRPTSGRIMVDGVDLVEIALADWYRRISTVFQQFVHYQATVRENIAFGCIEKSDDASAVATAAARSDAASMAAALPAGLETPLGREFHDGVELSVGQWQKLAIARSYLRDAEVLVLDEPTSALDARAEAEVYEQFAHMSQGSTVILISHRLGSCRIADRVLVLDQGRLIESGTHADLLASGSKYADLYQMQAAWYQ